VAVSHIKSNTIADFTGTITGFNSQGSTTTIAATNLVRPADWNSAHNQFYTLTGNTTGNSTASGTNIIFAGSGGISIGGSTGSIIISASPKVTRNGFNPYPDYVHTISQQGQGTLILDPEDFPDFVFDRAIIPIYNTNSSNSSGSHTLSFWIGLYSKNNSTLSLHASASRSAALTHSGTQGVYASFSGMRHFSIGWTTTITEGQYWIGFLSRTTSGGANGTYSNVMLTQMGTNFLGHFSSSHNTTYQWTLGQGIYTVTTSGMPGSIGFSELRGSDSAIFRAQKVLFASGTV
jgi:hypothetical protein